jgi:GAF domain-containing protein
VSSVQGSADRCPTDDGTETVSGSQPLGVSIPLTDELAGVFARMSGLILSEETVETSLHLLSGLARETVPGAVGAGVSVIDERGRRSSGSTDERVREADNLQYELNEGPCLDAAAARELVRVDDLATDQRWPGWAPTATRLGLRAAMSSPLVIADGSLGALKVYADEPHTFDAHGEQLMALFSAQAAVLVANVQSYDRAKRLSEGMRQAVHDRDVISMAKGVLMGRRAVDEDSAFGMLLARCAQDGTSIAEAARAIVDSVVRRRR